MVTNEDAMADGKTKGMITRTCSLCVNKAEDLEATDYMKTIPSLKITKKLEDGYVVATAENDPYYTYTKGVAASCSEAGRVDEYSFIGPDGKTIVIELNVKTFHYLVVGGVLKEIDAYSVYCTADFEVGQLKVIGGPERETCSWKGADGYCICDECRDTIAIEVRNEHEAYDPTKHVVADITEATCTMQGYLRYTCTVCAEDARAVMPALGHNWMFCSFASAVDGELTLNVSCNRCSESQVITATAEVVTVAPSCTIEGYKGYTNITTNDGFVISEIIDGVEYPLVIKTEAIPALGHNHETLGRLTYVDLEKAFDIRESKYANAFTALGDIVCGSTAETAVPGYFVCSECADSIRVNLYKSHTGDAKVVEENGDRAATCTEAGQMTIDGTCTDCGQGGLVLIPALGHVKVYTCNYDEESEKWTVSWRCEREGCTNNGVLENVKDVKITSKSTCIKNGSAVVSFTDDTADLDVTLVKTGHTLGDREMVLYNQTEFVVSANDEAILYSEGKVVYNYEKLSNISLLVEVARLQLVQLLLRINSL